MWVRVSRKGGVAGIWRRMKRRRGEGGGRTSESLLNLIRIHPGRGAEEQCREATVIYKQQKQPGCSKIDESHSFCATVIKGEFHPKIHLTAYVHLYDEGSLFSLLLYTLASVSLQLSLCFIEQ